MSRLYFILKTLTALLALFFLVIGFQWLFVPHNLAGQFSIEAVGIAGVATMRADLGAFFVSAGIITACGVRDHASANAFVFCAALLIGTAAFGRLVGFILDGITPLSMTPFIIELMMVALYVALARVRIRVGAQAKG